MFGSLGIVGFVLAKSSAFSRKDEALKVREELKRRFAEEYKLSAQQTKDEE